MQRKDHISGNLAETQEIVFMLASGRQTIPGEAKKSARATFLSENVLKHLNQQSEFVLALHFVPCGCSIFDVVAEDWQCCLTEPFLHQMGSVHSPAKTGTKLAAADPEKFQW